MTNPWCKQANAELPLQDLITISNATYGYRYEVLEALINLDPLVHQFRNYEFGELFYQLLTVDDLCFCRGIISQSRYLNPAIHLGSVIGRGKVGAAYDVLDRNNAEMPLVIKLITDIEYKNYLSIQVEMYSMSERDDRTLNYLKVHQFFDIRGYPITFSFRSDDFANQTILHMLLDIILSAYDNNNFVKQIDAFICNGTALYRGIPAGYNGYNITERAYSGDLSIFFEREPSITTALIDEILDQIFWTLRILQQKEYYFIHSDLKAKNIFVSGTAERRIYKIADYDKASITWRGVRFYNRRILAEFAGKLTTSISSRFYTPSSSDITTSLRSITIVRGNDNVYYYNVSKDPYISIATRHTNIPFYFTYDIASFLWSLVMEPSVYLWYRNTSDSRFHFAIRFIFGTNQSQILSTVLDNIYKEYNSERGERQKDKLVAMRSISHMNRIFFENDILIHRDLDDFYDRISIRPVQNIDIQRLPPGFYDSRIVLSNERKPCVTPCEKYTYTRQDNAYISNDGQYRIDYDEVDRINALRSEFMACRTYPYTNGGYEYTWDKCER